MNEENKSQEAREGRSEPTLADIVNGRASASSARVPTTPRQAASQRPTQAQAAPPAGQAQVSTPPNPKKPRKRRKEHSEHSERLKKRITLIAFAVFSLVSIIVCTQVAYSYSGDSIRIVTSSGAALKKDTRDYRIVYSESDAWGLSAATALQTAFLEKTGATLSVVPDSETAVLHEIRIGHTNRAGDDYITSLSTLGENGYAIILTSDDSVNVIALSESGAEAATKYFVTNYVGAYRYGKLTLTAHHSFTLVDRTGDEPLATLRETKLPLAFSADGSFRVLVLSDADTNEYTIKAIADMTSTENVDLVVFAGDVSGGIETKSALEAYVKKLTLPLEENSIPWTVVLGEQDTDGGLDAAAQMDVYSSFAHCVAKEEITEDDAVSCFLPIYPHGDITPSSVPAFGIWTLGQTAMLSEYKGTDSDDLLALYKNTGTDYGIIPMSHIAFFTENSGVIDREIGGSLDSLIITHTPLPEFSLIAANQSKTEFAGEMGESVSASPVNSGLFAAALSNGSVRGIYAGHDHLNSFSGVYCGIELGYCASIGFDGYGFGGTFEINNKLRGGRLIELKETSNGIKVTSKMIYAADYSADGETEVD